MRAHECPASYALPAGEDKPGFPAIRGTYIHKYLELHWVSPEESELFAIRTESEYLRKLAFCIDADGIVADVRDTAFGEVEHELLEQPFAYQDGTIRLLERTNDRNTQYPPGSFGGTADVIIVTDTMVSVVDYKSGSAPVDPDSPQMRVLAAFAYLVWQRAVSTTILTINASSFSKNKCKPVPHYPSSKMWTNEELEGCTEYMRAIYSRVQQARDDRKKGLPVVTNPDEERQCKWCSSKPYCPSYAEVAAE